MNILHAHTDPSMLARLREMLRSAARADIAVGYFFVSGFAQAADELARLRKTRVLVGQADRPTLEAVAAGMRQADPLRSQLEIDDLTSPGKCAASVADAAANISHGIAAMDQTKVSADAVECLRDLVASGRLEMRSYPRGFMRAKPTCAGTTTTPSKTPLSWARPTSPWRALRSIPSLMFRLPATQKWPRSNTGLTRCGKTRWTSPSRSKTR